MGEKKVIKKERKSPSQKKGKKKVEPAEVVPLISRRSWLYHKSIPISCPSFSNNDMIYKTTVKNVSGSSGGITKSWISSRCTYQTWPQLAEINISPKVIDTDRWDNNYRVLDNIPLRLCAHSTNHDSMVITGISSPAFAFYRWGNNKGDYMWRTRNCRIMEPYSNDYRFMEFTNIIALQGIYYLISSQGCLALVQYDGDSCNYEITALGRSRVVPNCRVSKHFREYLLEYKGEIYVVFLLSRASIKVVDNVEVFRLDKSRLLLEKVDRLVDDAMFFVEDDRCMGISASLLGCSKGSNCVYFTHDRAGGSWFVYDMKSSCISTTPGPEIDLI